MAARAVSGSGDVDTDHNGVISIEELTAYVADHLSRLTVLSNSGSTCAFAAASFAAGL